MRSFAARFFCICVGLVLVLATLCGCSGSSVKENSVSATRVGTQKASRGTLDITGTYIGTVAPHNTVDVTPLVSGTVLTVYVKVGDKVKKGDLLCKFDDKAVQLQLKSAQNAVDSAKAGKEAAEDQIESARKQADASVTSMEGQKKTLRTQKKAAEDQLEQLKDSIDDLKKGSESAQEAYKESKRVYDEANALFIQYQAFLTANPDCLTTAGLIEASIPAASGLDTADNSVKASETDLPSADSSPKGKDKAAEKKQKTAAALLKALNEIPLTVEYLTQAGLNTLKDQMDQASTAAASASGAYTQAMSSMTQLNSSISQIEAQIEALEDNIDAAEDAADSAGSTKAYDAQIKAAQTGVDSARYQVDLYTVTSPIDGIVENVRVRENEISAQGYSAFTISDKEAMEVSFYVPEEVRDYLKPGDAVRVEASSGEVKGRVSSIATAVDSQKGLFRIESQITTGEGHELLSNTSVSLSLVTNSVKDQILIPFDSVYYDNDQAYVFLAQGDRAVRRNIRAGLYNNEMIAVMEGLSDGDEVIATWGAGLKDGAPIQVIETK